MLDPRLYTNSMKYKTNICIILAGDWLNHTFTSGTPYTVNVNCKGVFA